MSQAQYKRGANRFIYIGWVGPKVTSRVRQYVARHYDALTLYAVRGYVALTQDTALRQFVTLTRGSRGKVCGSGRAVICLLKFFVLVSICPRLAGRLDLYPSLNLE